MREFIENWLSQQMKKHRLQQLTLQPIGAAIELVENFLIKKGQLFMP